MEEIPAILQGLHEEHAVVNGNKRLLHGPHQLVFEKCGIDAMGPLPRTKNGKLHILVAIDYMTRWVEAKSVARINEKTVSTFVYTHICCIFGTPLEIVFENGPGFRKGLLTEVCEEFHILHWHSTPYYPQSNGLVEKANGVIARIIRKMVKNKTKLWDDFLDGALWAYRTTYREATEFTPFQLVYGQEALQPIELNIPTMRLHGKGALDYQETWTYRLLTLVKLEWKRETAYECFKRKDIQTKEKHDKKLKDKGIKEGDLVLRYDNRLDNRFDAKFETRRQGPYIVKKAFNSSYYQLMDLDGKEHPRKVNGYRLKPYLSRILPKDLQDQHQKATLSHKSFNKLDINARDSRQTNVRTSSASSLERFIYLFKSQNLNPRAPLKSIPQEIEQHHGRARAERRRMEEAQNVEMISDTQSFISEDVSTPPMCYSIHEGRAESMELFARLRPYTLAIAGAPYGFKAPLSVHDDVKYGVSAYKKVIDAFKKVTTVESWALVFFHAHDQTSAAAEKAFKDKHKML
ncbi:hypothetical protein L7F22_057475 [Adiantum nelumboides]|nr:hypothetical protein [Adiantum nelumboides]